MTANTPNRSKVVHCSLNLTQASRLLGMTKFKLAPKFGLCQWDGKISTQRASVSASLLGMTQGCRGKRRPKLCDPSSEDGRLASGKLRAPESDERWKSRLIHRLYFLFIRRS